MFASDHKRNTLRVPGVPTLVERCRLEFGLTQRSIINSNLINVAGQNQKLIS